jgi:hypothetical protein
MEAGRGARGDCFARRLYLHVSPHDPARAEEAEAGSMTASDRPSTMKPMNDVGMQNIAFSLVAGIYTIVAQPFWAGIF